MSEHNIFHQTVQARIQGRPWIVAMDVLVPAARTAKQLLELGASRVLAIGGSRGTGALPDPDVVPQITLGVTGPDMMGSIRAAEAALAAVPPAVQVQIDAFDPAGEARVIGTLFSGGAPVGGRAMYGARPVAWQALEDKVIIDALWDAAGVARSPCAIVPPTLAALTAAAAPLDAGAGTVWAGDARAGFNGGGAYVRWVRDAEQAREAAQFFARECDTVRVMPFLDGLPCSIHGFVLPDRVVAVRPCEMVIFRIPGSAQFGYAGPATFWDPPAADRAAMQAVARRVGAHLRDTVDYRGAFTVDGVLTVDGFRPTELNPRFGGGMPAITRGLGAPLYLLNLMIVEGEPLPFEGAAFEAAILASADGERAGWGHRMLRRPITEQTALHIARDGDGWRIVDEDDADVRLDLGPGPMGGYVRASMLSDRTPVGPSVAPRIASALRFASDHWGLGLDEMRAAPDLRAPR